MGLRDDKEDAARALTQAASADGPQKALEFLIDAAAAEVRQGGRPSSALRQLALGSLDADRSEELFNSLGNVILEAAHTRDQAREERAALNVERRRMNRIHEATLAAQADAEAKLAQAEAAARARAVRPRPRRAPPCGDAAGHDLRPDPLAARTGAELMETLRQFREWAGRPPYREMAARCGHRAGVSTMNTALRRDELPDRLWLLDAIVEGCGGTEEDRAGFSTAWRMLTGNTSAEAGERGARRRATAQGRQALRALPPPDGSVIGETGHTGPALRPAAGQSSRSPQ